MNIGRTAPFAAAVDKRQFWNALSRLRRAQPVAVASSSDFSKIDLVAEGDSLMVSSSFSTFMTEFSLPALVSRPGRCRVPSRGFTEAVRRLPNQPVTLVGDKDEVRLTAGRFTANWRTLPWDEDVIWEGHPDPAIEVSSKAFGEGMSHVSLAVASEWGRTEEASDIEVNFGLEALTFTATDRHSVAIAEIAGDLVYRSGLQRARRLHVPWWAMGSIVRVLPTTGELSIGSTDGVFALGFDGGRIQVLVGAVRFPHYAPVVESDMHDVVLMNRHELLDSLRRVGIIDSFGSGAQLCLSTLASEVLVRITDKSFGEFADRLPCDVQATPAELVFNLAAFWSAIERLRGPSVRLAFGAADKPCVLVSPTHPGARYYIEPLSTLPPRPMVPQSE